jgi:hypothetical protein
MSDEQGTAAWLFARTGHVTASRFNDVIAKTKGGKPTAAREKYFWELVVERITGQPQDHYTAAALEWGSAQEGPSRMAYEVATGLIVEEVGFIKHPVAKWVGGSPDGLIDDEGGWESKSPYNSAIHLQTVLGGMPEDHMAQVQGLMWITGRKWWDFQSFDPRLPEYLQRFCVRVPRNSDYIADLAAEVIVFSAEVDQRVGQILAVVGTESATHAAKRQDHSTPRGHE